MSDTETTPQPRRSQRDKRQTTRLGEDGLGSKRKRPLDDEEDVVTGQEEEDAIMDDDDDDDDDAEAYHTKSSKPRTVKEKSKPSPAKKVKANVPKKRPGRKPKSAIDVTQISKETNISDDNTLFNAILNPATALQTTVEDFLESFSQTPAVALADLVTCVLRSCGCNDSVDADQVTDHDGVVDALDTFNEELKKENSPTYPLNSKLAVFKPFRKSLSEFLDRLVQSSVDSGVLHSSDLIPTLQVWVIAMSSSVIRSFRHTATVVALETQTALCQVASAIDRELETVQRQREGERRKKTKGAGGGREKELERKTAEIKNQRTKISDFIKEFFDGVFVHRYRDLDPAIRADCVQALGKWLITHSSYFLDGSYLRYIGWVLSDSISSVRLAAVKALASLYAKKDYAVSLGHFTDRFKGRLVEMASRDMDLTIRVATIGLLGNIDQLEEEERDRICLMVFDEEPRVRKAVSGFVKGVWQEAVEDRMVGQSRDGQTLERVGIKCLSELLVKWSRILDQDQDDPETSSQSQAERPPRMKEVSWLVSGQVDQGRIAIAVDALSDEIAAVADWQPLLDVLLLDHSSVNENSSNKRGRKGKTTSASNSDEAVCDVWRLEEVEESVMLEVLVAALIRARGLGPAIATAQKKGREKDDTVASEITRALIKSLPRLVSKNQTVEGRIAEVLLIPQVMNLDMYLEMRMVTAYEALWDDVTKQFLTHSSTSTIAHAVSTINFMSNATTLSATNATKILELEEELANALRDAVAGREELEIATFSEDETRKLASVCSRLAALIKARDMTSWMEEDEGGKQSSAWNILWAILERGSLGYEQEEKMIVDTLDVLAMHILWRIGSLSISSTPSTEDISIRDSLMSMRDAMLDKLTDYAVGGSSNACEEIKRTAFQHVLSLYALFRPLPQSPDIPSRALALSGLEVVLPDEAQFRFAGFVQSEIDQYVDELQIFHELQSRNSSPGLSGPEEENSTPTGKGRANDTVREKKNAHRNKDGISYGARNQMEREYIMNSVTSSFIRAIRARVIEVRHAGIILAHYGRLDPTFDICAKTVVDVLREEGMLNSKGEIVVSVTLQALRESFSLFLDGIEPDESHTMALVKLLTSCFVIRGAQLSIVRRLEPSYLVHFHTTSITWIVKKITGYHSGHDNKLRNRALVFFRVLAYMLIHLESRDTLQIKAHLDQTFALAKLEAGVGKAWEPYRIYEKKLSPNTKAKSRKTRAKRPGVGDGLSEEENDKAGFLSSENEDFQPPPSQRRRPRPTPKALHTQGPGDTLDMDRDPLQTPQATRYPNDLTATYSTKPKSNVAAQYNSEPLDHESPLSPLHSHDPITSRVPEDSTDGSHETLQQRHPLAPVDPDIPNFRSKRKRIRL